MEQKTINKVGKLLARVIKLNENAKPGEHYHFEFAGHINGVTLRKTTLPDFQELVQVHAYLDKNDLGYPLRAVEAVIAIEEKAQKEEQ